MAASLKLKFLEGVRTQMMTSGSRVCCIGDDQYHRKRTAIIWNIILTLVGLQYYLIPSINTIIATIAWFLLFFYPLALKEQEFPQTCFHRRCTK